MKTNLGGFFLRFDSDWQGEFLCVSIAICKTEILDVVKRKRAEFKAKKMINS